jgi:cell wall-associated NlpC family hydrolase
LLGLRSACRNCIACVVSLGLLLSIAAAPSALAETGGSGLPPQQQPDGVPPPATGTGGGGAPGAPVPTTTPGAKAKLAADGRTAIAPAGAPDAVKKAIAAANRITRKPYVWGGGHGRWDDRGYDCSGAASYVLHGAGLLDSPGDAVVLGRLSIMNRGAGQWISYYWNHQHGYMVIAGMRFDTSGPGPRGPRWRSTTRVDWARFYARHPEGL